MIEEVEAHAAERLVLAEGQTPAAELARYKRFLKDEAARLKKLHLGGGNKAANHLPPYTRLPGE